MKQVISRKSATAVLTALLLLLTNAPAWEQIADFDGYGMSDYWEMANGLDPMNPLHAYQDLDGDGRTNLQEYSLGSDPRNPGDPMPIAPRNQRELGIRQTQGSAHNSGLGSQDFSLAA